jgi:succinate-semialdehyde dehydrogenase / glutarate-semialdehyde dehydrogenase
MTIQLNDPTLLKSECLIDGQWISSLTGHTINVYNPFNQELIGTVPNLVHEQIN